MKDWSRCVKHWERIEAGRKAKQHSSDPEVRKAIDTMAERKKNRVAGALAAATGTKPVREVFLRTGSPI